MGRASRKVHSAGVVGPKAVSSVDLRRLCQLLVLAALTWLALAAAGNAAAARATQFRGNAACNLLDYAGMAQRCSTGNRGASLPDLAIAK